MPSPQPAPHPRHAALALIALVALWTGACGDSSGGGTTGDVPAGTRFSPTHCPPTGVSRPAAPGGEPSGTGPGERSADPGASGAGRDCDEPPPSGSGGGDITLAPAGSPTFIPRGTNLHGYAPGTPGGVPSGSQPVPAE
ncbi:hypothetical protein [Actinoplanes teichomyceticus]|uniref:Lipoprotein n=1 Tax=Actinoplanes teichomyceticus TaxID=1867 RepID=A0A561WKK0_ACTTI|nr:hypothetical protein [Actinoplanes teichomyceticus]TWG24385.1 hypothetical protein FHX34_102941 [Actinoplanes teichomyceticus]GIF12763.1 hypothetical protein Ate01nite_27950 [Actinoplanes teichomyceticus]